MKRVAIVGSRDYPHLSEVAAFVHTLEADAIVISGGARGVDETAEREARFLGMQVEVFAADWNTHGRKAGLLRNQQIVDAADEVWAFWDGASRGTMDTVNKARAAGKPVVVREASK